MHDNRRPTPAASGQAQDAGTQLQTRLKALAFEAVSDGVVLTDEGGRVTEINPAAERMFGRRRDDVLGRDVEPVLRLRGPDIDRTGGLLAGVRRNGGWSGELHWERDDGAAGLASTTVLPVYDDAGELTGTIGVIRDLTGNRSAAEALADSERRRQEAVSLSIRAEESERARIASDLHDDTIQALTAALLSLDRLGQALDADRPDRAADILRRTRETLGEAAERARRLMFQLRPPLLEEGGLDPAIRETVAQAAIDGGFDTDVEIAAGRLDEALEALVFRTVSEAVANVLRHAHAHRLRVRLHARERIITGLVEDDGVGFNTELALDRSRMRLHLGLEGMAERVRLAGGRLDIESAPGRGTSVRFSLPAGEPPV